MNGTLALFMSEKNLQNVRLQDIHTEGPYSVLTELISSAERPASSTLQPEGRAMLQEATPLWNDFIDEVSEEDEHIVHKCFDGDLLHK